MTNIALHTRHRLLSDLGTSGLLLVHGGAGPQDPKGEHALQARASLQLALNDTPEPWHPDWQTAAHQTLHAFRAEVPDHSLQAPGSVQASGTPRAPHIRRGLSAVAVLERDPLFNAGWGAAIQADGQTRVSAAFMESAQQKFSSVVNALDCLHPSLLAAHLQGHYHSMLDSTGAAQLMSRLKLPQTNLATPKRFAQFVEKKSRALETAADSPSRSNGTGTVGAVTVSPQGLLSTTTSTGGVGYEPPGRIGDSGTVSGTYADGQTAISCTGYGEQITDLGFAVRTAVLCQTGLSLEDAMEKCLSEAAHRGFGLAAIAAHVRDGKVTWCMGTTESYFVWAWCTGSESSDFLTTLEDARTPQSHSR